MSQYKQTSEHPAVKAALAAFPASEHAGRLKQAEHDADRVGLLIDRKPTAMYDARDVANYIKNPLKIGRL